MALVVQGSGKTFGPELIREFERPECRRVDIAVAWVRASGLRHLQKAMVDALGRGVLIRVVVGIDADNTSYEGLKGLIDIGATGPAGAMRLVVRHNEAGHIFHPKIYAFRTEDELRLFAGSNNMTQAGLFQNEELSYCAKRTLPNKLATDLDAFFASLMPPGGGLSKTLDAAFLEALRDKGYVSGEQRLRAKASAKTAAKRKAPLFGRVGRGAPAAAVAAAPLPVPVVPDPPAPIAGDLDWQRLVIRLRISRGTQGQIPIDIFHEMRRRANQTGEDDVLILKKTDGTVGRISKSRKGARGKSANTYKIEALTQKMDPILHVYPVGNDLYYEIFSGLTGVGLGLVQHLESGFDTDPPKSFFTRKPRPTATWWRFD